MATLTESFNKADGDLGPDQTWVNDTAATIVVVSNEAQHDNDGRGTARISSLLDTENHYVKAKCEASSLVSPQVGVAARKANSSTLTFYYAHLRGATDVCEVFRSVANVFTSLATAVATSFDADTQYLVELKVVAGRLEVYVDSVNKFRVGDSNITGNLAVGLSADRSASETVLNKWDDFEAGDLSAVLHRASIAGSGNTTTSVTLVIPASTVANDIVIAAFTNGGATADPSVSDNEGAGTWTKLLSGNDGTSNLSIWWKRASANTASKTITASGFTDSCCGVASVYSGAKQTGNPYENETFQSNASGTETHAAITPSQNGSMVCLTVGQAPDLAVATQAATNPSVLIERAEHLSTGGADSSVSHASEVQITASTTGTMSWTQTNSTTMSIAFNLIPHTAAEEPADLASAGVATASFTGASTAGAAISSTGVATGAFTGQSTNAASLASDGVATATFNGGGLADASIASDGVATAAFTGQHLGAGALTSDGVATGAFTAQSTAGAALNSDGVAAAALVGQSTAEAVLNSDGVGAFNGVGQSTAESVLNAAGIATVSIAADDTVSGDLISDGVATAAFVAESFFAAEMNAQGVGAFDAVGEEVGGAAAGHLEYRITKRVRRRM